MPCHTGSPETHDLYTSIGGHRGHFISDREYYVMIMKKVTISLIVVILNISTTLIENVFAADTTNLQSDSSLIPIIYSLLLSDTEYTKYTEDYSDSDFQPIDWADETHSKSAIGNLLHFHYFINQCINLVRCQTGTREIGLRYFRENFSILSLRPFRRDVTVETDSSGEVARSDCISVEKEDSALRSNSILSLT